MLITYGNGYETGFPLTKLSMNHNFNYQVKVHDFGLLETGKQYVNVCGWYLTKA